jgi:excisionase family DNA binding protein
MEPVGSNNQTPVLLTVKQVAEILQWNPYTITKKAEKGELPAFKMGREWRFRQEDIVKWIDEKRNGK